jgi:hypothetical protein
MKQLPAEYGPSAWSFCTPREALTNFRSALGLKSLHNSYSRKLLRDPANINNDVLENY